MLIHHLKTAVRAFLARKLHTVVNVLGLALGFSCFVSAYVFNHYVDSADRHFSNAERIRVVFQKNYIERVSMDTGWGTNSSYLLTERLRNDLPEIEAVARLTRTRETVVSTGESWSFRRVRFAEPSFLDVFEFDYRHGSAEAVRGRTRSAILTEQAASAMFGRANVLGETIELSDGQLIEIGGVISAILEPSHLGVSIFSDVFDVLVTSAIPEETGAPADNFRVQPGWLNSGVYNYVLLPPDGRFTAQRLNEYLAELGPRLVDGAEGSVEFEARPVYQFAAHAVDHMLWNDYPIYVTSAMLLLGALVLAIAGANYVNLATAVVTARTREISVRKIVGGSRTQIVLQYLLEATLTAGVALFLALVAVQLAIPAVNVSTQRNFSIPWSSEFGWFVTGVVIVCGLLVGAFPAVLLSRIRPTQALRMSSWGTNSRAFRTYLIAAQFVAASFLVIVMLVVQKQNATLREAGLRFADDPYIVIGDTAVDVGVDADVLRSEILRSPQIVGVAGASVLPWERVVTGTAYSRSPDPAVEAVFVQTRSVTFDYFTVLGLEFLAGMPFAEQQQPRPREEFGPIEPDGNIILDNERVGAVILDQTAAQLFGWSNPVDAVGDVIYVAVALDGRRRPAEIVGVVEPPPFEVIGGGFNAFVYGLSRGNRIYPIVRVASDGVGPALSHIDSVWQELVPHSPIRREFMDARFQQMYDQFTIIIRVFVALAALGLGVAAMGLFGIAAFVTERRQREVGIRKSMGATATQIGMVFARDFCKPVIVANLMAWPFGFMVSTVYLNRFVQRAELGAEPFLASLGLTVLVALVAVASQVVTAARTQPARVLRHE